MLRVAPGTSASSISKWCLLGAQRASEAKERSPGRRGEGRQRSFGKGVGTSCMQLAATSLGTGDAGRGTASVCTCLSGSQLGSKQVPRLPGASSRCPRLQRHQDVCAGRGRCVRPPWGVTAVWPPSLALRSSRCFSGRPCWVQPISSSQTWALRTLKLNPVTSLLT